MCENNASVFKIPSRLRKREIWGKKEEVYFKKYLTKNRRPQSFVRAYLDPSVCLSRHTKYRACLRSSQSPASLIVCKVTLFK